MKHFVNFEIYTCARKFGFGAHIRLAALLLLSIGIQLLAQQSEADQKMIEKITAKAEKGDAAAQCCLAKLYFDGTGTTKDMAEAAKWFRKSAEQGFAEAEEDLGTCYAQGYGVNKDRAEAVKWFRKAADRGVAEAEFNLGVSYENGYGARQDAMEAIIWYRKAADKGFAGAQCNLGTCYFVGEGTPKDAAEGVRWWRKAAEQGSAQAQAKLGAAYYAGEGVPKDLVQAYTWYNLAAAQGHEIAAKIRANLEVVMLPEQVFDAQRLSQKFKPRSSPEPGAPVSSSGRAESTPSASGTGFFITEDGFLITNHHVVRDATQIRLVTGAGLIAAKLVKLDAANDLALLKAEGRFAPLSVAASRGVKLGGTVATVGFPNIGLQGFAPKLAKGEIASLSGPQDDARYFQISVPVQPGNSGGALVDERGNVVGVVSAKLDAAAAFAATGTLPENVNYAVKSGFLLSFLESVPEVSAKVKEPETKDQKFEDVVRSAEQAAVLVLVY
ncbi:MAG TPA: tetratricopeptide repeat-containing serine protease family protein [Verrucomicrobiae bacterium]|nr:tetratricopeptide repeat-containing serine protease family protein [Verrucomicrobiae bacterium]